MELRSRNLNPVAVSLSGGVDSIAMVAALRRIDPAKTILTFSIGDRMDDPELTWARKVADRFQTEHHEIICGADRLRSEFPKLVWHLEDPVGRSETLLAFCLAREIAKHSNTVFRGDAADGLYGGMPRHKILALASRLPFSRNPLGQIYSFTQTGVSPTNILSKTLVRLYFGNRITPPPRVLGAEPATGLDPLPAGDRRELLNRVLLGGSASSVPSMMGKVDRTHAAYAVRGICPFVDQQMIACAFQVPSNLKHNGRRNKIVWREAVREFLPDDLANRPKFPQRIQESRAFCDALADIAGSLLAPGRVRSRGWFDPQDVSRLLVRPPAGLWSPEHAMRLWTLVLVEIWARLFIDQGGAAAAVARFDHDAAPDSPFHSTTK